MLIIQNDTGNKYSPAVIVAAVTSKIGIKAKLPTHSILKGGSGGLEVSSLVLLEQIRTLDKRHLTEYIGSLSSRNSNGSFLCVRSCGKRMRFVKPLLRDRSSSGTLFFHALVYWNDPLCPIPVKSFFMGNQKNRSGKFQQSVLQGLFGLYIQMVGRLV